MNAYVSLTPITAQAMSFGEFCKEFNTPNLDIPENTPGYLIYLSPTYPTWIDQEEFESTYILAGNIKELKPYQQRLMIERSILKNNLDKLESSMVKPTFLTLPMSDRELLKSQARAMKSYLSVLNKRASAFIQ